MCERESIEETEQGIKREEEKKDNGGGLCCDGKRRIQYPTPHHSTLLSHTVTQREESLETKLSGGFWSFKHSSERGVLLSQIKAIPRMHERQLHSMLREGGLCCNLCQDCGQFVCHDNTTGLHACHIPSNLQHPAPSSAHPLTAVCRVACPSFCYPLSCDQPKPPTLF